MTVVWHSFMCCFPCCCCCKPESLTCNKLFAQNNFEYLVKKNTFERLALVCNSLKKVRLKASEKFTQSKLKITSEHYGEKLPKISPRIAFHLYKYLTQNAKLTKISNKLLPPKRRTRHETLVPLPIQWFTTSGKKIRALKPTTTTHSNVMMKKMDA